MEDIIALTYFTLYSKDLRHVHLIIVLYFDINFRTMKLCNGYLSLSRIYPIL